MKKSVFSYIVCAVFALFSGFGIFSMLKTAGFDEMLGLPLFALIGGVCAYLLLTAAVFAALRLLFGEIGKRIKDKKRLEAILSVSLPVLTVLGAAVYLAFYLLNFAPMTLKDDTFYRMALSLREGGVSVMVHGASWLYTCLLYCNKRIQHFRL